jgi:transcriptional regulator with XRE-family HTH domain
MDQILIEDWKTMARRPALPCNRELLQKLRRHKGWTQAQLAKVVGYSERLISKAETGHPISLESIENLADALSGEDRIVYPEDLIADPLLTTREIILQLQQIRAAAIDDLQCYLDEKVEMHLVGHRNAKSCPSVSCGRTKVLSVLRYLWNEVGGTSLHLGDLHCFGSGAEVAVWSKLSCESTEAGAKDGVQTCTRLEFRRGRIWRIELMIDAANWQVLMTASS